MPGDLVLTLALAVGVAGLVQFPSSPRRTTDLTRMVLDGIVIGGSILLVADVTLFPDLLVDNPGGWPLLVVPVTDVVLATLATLLYLRSRRDHLMLGLVAASFFCFAASDFGFAFVGASGRQFTYGSIVDAGWLSGYLLLVLAIWAPAVGPDEPERGTTEKSPVLGTAVMFTLFLVALGITLSTFSGSGVSTPAVVLLLLVVLAVLARQSLLGLDNDRLRRRLEERVAERTRSLRQISDRTDLLVDSVGEGIYGVDRDGLITFVNPAAAQALGYAADELTGCDAHVTFHARGADGQLLPKDQCYITEAVRRGPGQHGRGRQLRALRRPAAARRGHHDPADRGGRRGRGRRHLPRRHPAPRGGPAQVGVRLDGQPRAAHPADRDPGVAGPDLRRRARPAARAGRPDARDRLDQRAPAQPPGRRHPRHRAHRVRRPRAAARLAGRARRRRRGGRADAGARRRGRGGDAGRPRRRCGARRPGPRRADADQPDRERAQVLLPGRAASRSPRARRATTSSSSRVTDEGRGIPDDRLERIFNRFEQVDSSDAREKGGFGLGLAISRSLVERSGGRIWATNNPDRGATLHFTLPRADAGRTGPSRRPSPVEPVRAPAGA